MSSADGDPDLHPDGVEVGARPAEGHSPAGGDPGAVRRDEPIADEDVTAEQAEATTEAALAEGHADATAAGQSEAVQPDVPAPERAATTDADSPPVTPPPGAEAEPSPGAEAEPEAEPPRDPTVPQSGDEERLALLQVFKDELGDAVVGAEIRDGDELWVRVTPEAWREAAQIARGKLGCTYFCFLSGMDWSVSPFGRSENSPLDPPAPEATTDTPGSTDTGAPGVAGGETRFQVLARVARPHSSVAVILKADVPDPAAGVPSWIPVYSGADWHERETWEMFGISFSGHPNLRHIYLPGDFEGHPLRKDFPLLARELKPWPGIVDVEPMPGEDATDGATEGAAEEEVS
ncbi:MAG: NADH-quinone oxidoreductase subunit C [Actinobacteria bacterium]|nr:NADH-quinone oxidoreductase subunit C [Actinomycetota bacterium]